MLHMLSTNAPKLCDIRNASESGLFDKAEALLEQALSVAPPGDDLARNNLEDARRRKRSAHRAHKHGRHTRDQNSRHARCKSLEPKSRSRLTYWSENDFRGPGL